MGTMFGCRYETPNGYDGGEKRVFGSMLTRLILIAICLFFGIGVLIAPYGSGIQTGHLVVALIFLIAAWVIARH